MKELLIVFFIVVLIIMAIAFPFKTRLMTHINFFGEKVFYSFKVMKIKLLTGRMFIDSNDGFVIENSENFFTAKFKKPFAKEFVNQFLSRLDVKKVETYFVGGLKNDSYSSAMISGFVDSVVKGVYSYLFEKYEFAKLYESVETTFDDDNLEFTIDVVISISLFSILKSILKANKLAKNKE